MSQSESRPRRFQRRYDQLLPGHEQCYECGGDGACNVCGGDGRHDGGMCTNCGGTGLCIICDGAGQIVPAKKRLTFVGVFREFDLDDRADIPSLADARGRRPPGHKAEVVAYLRAGKPMLVSPGGMATDVFDSKQKTTTRAVVTDGKFAWSLELSYYVDKYDVALPEQFEKHMAVQGYRMPEVETSKLALPW